MTGKFSLLDMRIGLREKVYENNGLTLLKVGVILLNFQRAA